MISRLLLALQIKGNTFIESKPSNTCHRIRDGDRCQADASRENIISNTCHWIRDCDRCQAAATFESIISNTCYRIRDGYWCQAAAIIVSIISWLSVFYTLNGRKVTVWILFRYEKVIFNVFNFRLHQKPMKRDRMRCFYWNRSMKSKGVIQILVWFSHQKNGIRITLQLGCNVYLLPLQPNWKYNEAEALHNYCGFDNNCIVGVAIYTAPSSRKCGMYRCGALQ